MSMDSKKITDQQYINTLRRRLVPDDAEVMRKNHGAYVANALITEAS